jgi:hypothetical protein
MNPILLTLTVLAQVAILHTLSPWHMGLSLGLGLTSVFALLAFSRHTWDAHLDMILAMLGYGGLGMLIPTLLTGQSCHHEFRLSHYATMSLLMWLFTLPAIWTEARCVQAFKRQGRGVLALAADAIGMQAGMLLAHVPLMLIPMSQGHGAWIAQAFMLVGMTLGMLAAQTFLLPRLVWNESEWNG